MLTSPAWLVNYFAPRICPKCPVELRLEPIPDLNESKGRGPIEGPWTLPMNKGNGLYVSCHNPKLVAASQVARQAAREILNAILWILRTGVPRIDPPERYLPRSTHHRRFQERSRSGVFSRSLSVRAEDLQERGGTDLREGFIDDTFAPAEKEAMAWTRPDAPKAPKLRGCTLLLLASVTTDAWWFDGNETSLSIVHSSISPV